MKNLLDLATAELLESHFCEQSCQEAASLDHLEETGFYTVP